MPGFDAPDLAATPDAADAGPAPVSASTELEELLMLFYQCPIGFLQFDEDGEVIKINPAAARMLAPVRGEASLATIFPLLKLIAPGALAQIVADPARLGQLGPVQRIPVPAGGGAIDLLELTAIRVQPQRVMLVLVDVSAERKLADREHQIAIELQNAMLGRVDETHSLEIGVTYRAAERLLQVGGDWYDVVKLPDNLVALIVGDVPGHHIEATAAMGQLRSAVRAVAQFCPDAVRLLQQADRLACEIEGAALATLACAILDPRTGILDYACAGHPPPLHMGQGGHVAYLTEGRGPPLHQSWSSARAAGSARLAPGDAIVLYTDGIYERPGDQGDPMERLRLAAERLSHVSTDHLGDRLVAEMLTGHAGLDDVCVLVARWTP